MSPVIAGRDIAYHDGVSLHRSDNVDVAALGKLAFEHLGDNRRLNVLLAPSAELGGVGVIDAVLDDAINEVGFGCAPLALNVGPFGLGKSICVGGHPVVLAGTAQVLCVVQLGQVPIRLKSGESIPIGRCGQIRTG